MQQNNKLQKNNKSQKRKGGFWPFDKPAESANAVTDEKIKEGFFSGLFSKRVEAPVVPAPVVEAPVVPAPVVEAPVPEKKYGFLGFGGKKRRNKSNKKSKKNKKVKRNQSRKR